MYFDSYETYGGKEYREIQADTYPDDTHQGKYYEFKLTSPGILVYRPGQSNNYSRITTFPTGTVFYSTSIYEIGNNNASKTVSWERQSYPSLTNVRIACVRDGVFFKHKIITKNRFEK